MAGHRHAGSRRYPRSARLNELLREVLADELERLDDERLELVTVTGVETSPDLSNATVYFSALETGEEVAGPVLAELRPALQQAVAAQVKAKRVPRLSFAPDPAVASGLRVEEILRNLQDPDHEPGREERDG